MTAHRPMTDVGDRPAGWLEPSLHTAYFRIFARVLEARQLPPPRAPAGRPRLLPLIDMLPALDAVAARDCPWTGIDVGLAIPGGAHGPMGITAISSPTIDDALVAVARYVPTRNHLFDYRCFRDAGWRGVELRTRLQLGDYTRFLQYATVVALFNIFRTIAEHEVLQDGRIHLPWAAPAASACVPPPIARCLMHGQDRLAIVFPDELACRPAHTADADVHAAVSKAGEEELRKMAGSVASQVRRLLNAQAPRWPSLDEVSDRLALSRRTLARRLSAEHLTFQDLLDEARSELACWYLRQTTVPIAEIVERTGFSEMSNFSRSFKRLQGLTPREYRSRFKTFAAE